MRLVNTGGNGDMMIVLLMTMEQQIVFQLGVYGFSRPQLLVGGPLVLFNFVLRALWPLRPCDPPTDAHAHTLDGCVLVVITFSKANPERVQAAPH